MIPQRKPNSFNAAIFERTLAYQLHCWAQELEKTMTRTLSTFVLAGALILGGTASVFAKDKLLSEQEFEARAHRAECLAERVHRIETYQQKLNKLRFGHAWHPRGPSVNVPELNPNLAGSAMALLLGGALVITGRRRRTVV